MAASLPSVTATASSGAQGGASYGGSTGDFVISPAASNTKVIILAAAALAALFLWLRKTRK